MSRGKPIRRTWKVGRVRRTSWGFTVQSGDSRQIRKFSSEWTTREQAEAALDAWREEQQAPAPIATASPVMTLAEAAAKYLAVKESEKKRTIRDDRLHMRRFRREFGDTTPLAAVTSAMVSDYEVRRMAEKTPGGKPIAPATLNRSLAALRCLLRLAAEEWGVLDKAPTIRLLREPKGRLCFLSEDEIARLLAACRQSHNPYLETIVIVALNSGMRRGPEPPLVGHRFLTRRHSPGQNEERGTARSHHELRNRCCPERAPRGEARRVRLCQEGWPAVGQRAARL